MSAACFLGVELLFLAATHIYGGPPWTLLGMIAFFAQIACDVRVVSLAALLPSLAWLAAFHATGNREFFFPFAMYLAAHVALSLAARSMWLGCLGGGGMVVVFLVIRAMQAASAKVLAVEFVVAAAILAVVLAVFASAEKHAVPAAAIVAAASVAACVSLAL